MVSKSTTLLHISSWRILTRSVNLLSGGDVFWCVRASRQHTKVQFRVGTRSVKIMSDSMLNCHRRTWNKKTWIFSRSKVSTIIIIIWIVLIFFRDGFILKGIIQKVMLRVKITSWCMTFDQCRRDLMGFFFLSMQVVQCCCKIEHFYLTKWFHEK